MLIQLIYLQFAIRNPYNNGMFLLAKGSAERSAEGFGFSAERSVVRPNLKMKVRSYTRGTPIGTLGIHSVLRMAFGWT